jgi:hypothetical protein
MRSKRFWTAPELGSGSGTAITDWIMTRERLAHMRFVASIAWSDMVLSFTMSCTGFADVFTERRTVTKALPSWLRKTIWFEQNSVVRCCSDFIPASPSSYLLQVLGSIKMRSSLRRHLNRDAKSLLLVVTKDLRGSK